MKLSNVIAGAAIAGAALVAGSANATVLLSLINPPPETVDYSLSFTATDTSTSLSVGGYQLPSYEQATDNVVSGGGSPQLLGGSWVFTPAAEGSLAGTYSDGTSVPALDFGGVGEGYYDVFTQTFGTTPGTTYTYSFVFTEDYYGPSGFEVTTTGGSAVPEPAAWAVMLVGLAGLGAMMRRRRALVAA